MQKHSFDKKELDAAGKLLVKSKSIPAAEIDRVVGDPYLLSRVKARIAESENAHQKRSPFLFLHPKALALSMTGLVALIIGVFVAMQGGSGLNTPDVAVSSPTYDTGGSSTTVETPGSEPRPQPVSLSEPAAVRTEKLRPQKASTRKPVIRETHAKRPEPKPNTAEFYAFAGVRQNADVDTGGRIIRVEMSRSSLFALGINLPLENDDQRPIKADLLVGRDGSTQAIRLVED